MLNSLESYREAGRAAAKARSRRDESLASFHTDWKNRAVRLEAAADREAARAAFDSAYREESGFTR